MACKSYTPSVFLWIRNQRKKYGTDTTKSIDNKLIRSYNTNMEPIPQLNQEKERRYGLRKNCQSGYRKCRRKR